MADMRGLAELLPQATSACKSRMSDAMALWRSPPPAAEIAQQQDDLLAQRDWLLRGA